MQVKSKLPQVPSQQSSLIRACLWMLLGISAFLGLMVGIRALSSTMSVFEMLTLRSVVAFFVLLGMMKWFDRPAISTARLSMHLTRNIFHFSGQYCWAVGIILLPLAEVIAIEFTTPIWSVILASIFLGERLTSSRVLVLGAGLIGVLVIVRPGFETVEWGTAIVFLATIAFAVTTLTSKKLTTSESVWTILFYMAVIQFFIGLIPSIFQWVWPVGIDYFWIFVIGVCGMVAHLGLIKAISLVDAATVLPLDYLRLPATFLIGYFFYLESMDYLVLAGASIIFAANYFHIRQESKSRPSIT